MWPVFLFVIVVVVLLPQNLISCNDNNDAETCSIDNKDEGCDGGSKKYTSSWRQYLNDIKFAQSAFKHCEFDDGSPDEFEGLFCNYAKVIEEDLAPYDTISPSMLDDARKVASNPVTYQLIQGVLYRSPTCLFPSRCDGIEHFLLDLASQLPDFELVLNNHDWPFVNNRFNPSPLPLFSFSKSHEYSDIFFPAWTFWAGGPAISMYPTGIGRWDIMSDTLIKASKQWSWQHKKKVAFFRGSRTSGERDDLVRLSRRKSELVDARYTKNQAWKSKEDTLGMEPAVEVTFEDHCRYKYLFNFRGVAASFRFKHLFLCGSLVLHVGSDWLEFFYPSMKPWIHYVPVNAGASQEEIEDLIEFLHHHDDKAEEIAMNGHAFIRDHLKMSDIETYWLALLKKYAEKLAFKPVPDKNNIIVTRTKRH